MRVAYPPEIPSLECEQTGRVAVETRKTHITEFADISVDWIEIDETQRVRDFVVQPNRLPIIQVIRGRRAVRNIFSVECYAAASDCGKSRASIAQPTCIWVRQNHDAVGRTEIDFRVSKRRSLGDIRAMRDERLRQRSILRRRFAHSIPLILRIKCVVQLTI